MPTTFYYLVEAATTKPLKYGIQSAIRIYLLLSLAHKSVIWSSVKVLMNSLLHMDSLIIKSLYGDTLISPKKLFLRDTPLEYYICVSQKMENMLSLEPVMKLLNSGMFSLSKKNNHNPNYFLAALISGEQYSRKLKVIVVSYMYYPVFNICM